ncbi:MAG: tRNA (N6-threonylcarbamoyladenosine(37)-N6)-methyltransferase TrmO [Clostridia bacterium]|nr:tRNA (N6-threonylcarbamoyladenosine(37)-N6)-methyltransferase TrmO [Clostridia bacterium]
MEIKPIAYIRNDFTSKFGIPRQSGIAEEIESVIVFEKEYRNPDALRGIEEFSHLWLIWEFSENKQSDEWSPTVRPPKLGGNVRKGVFATRSPFRPNPLGLSCVKLIGTKKNEENGTVIIISGADLMNGTPIYDIKPYVPYSDSHPEASAGFAVDEAAAALSVKIPQEVLSDFPENKLSALSAVLSQDPRPGYHHSPERLYGLEFAGYDVRFRVDGNVLTVCEIEKL